MAPLDFQMYFNGTISQIARAACGFNDEFQARVYPANARFGDFQANGIITYAKQVGENPIYLAKELLSALMSDEDFAKNIAAADVAGAGFINFKLSADAIDNWLRTYDSVDSIRESIESSWRGRTIVVDYSGPNSAKQMHVGHLRSLVIGDALQKIFSFCGADVLRDNHVGDWGTQFGILLRQIRIEAIDLSTENFDDLLELLESAYRRGHAAAQESEKVLNEARAELLALQSGDSERVGLWKQINAISYASFQEIYDLAGVQFDYALGESFYRDLVDRVYKELLECGIAKEDSGALLVFHSEHERFCEQPFMVRKSDGASNYATTDLATILYRVENLAADDIVYVTDCRQCDHFEQLFLTVEKWFRAKNYRIPRLYHVPFGTICGPDGKAIKTRSGESVRLKRLFAEAIDAARKIAEQKSNDIDEKSLGKISKAIGVGAIKYGDLSQNRSSDYVFSFDKMLSLDGNTAPYLQYAVARIRSIFRKIPDNFPKNENFTDKLSPQTCEENALVRHLLRFPVAVRQTIEELRPHLLCTYLYELAGAFSAFYNVNRVFCENHTDSRRRIIFCERTLLVLELGLQLIGVETLERM
jgi:arginyl-tRNA synthetase